MSERFDITGLDIGILVVYLILSRIIPLILNPKVSDDSEGYFLGSRNFIWPLIGFSLFASNMSGSHFVGLAAAGYNQGIAVFNYEWMAVVILVIFMFFILPFYLRSRVFTMPEFLEKRYDVRSRMAFSGFTLFANMFIDMAAALFAGAVVLRVLFPAIPLWVTVLALALLAGIYTVVGGLGAVVISDSIQTVVLYIGGALVFFLTLREIPSWDAIRQERGPEHFSLIQPIGDSELPWPGLLTGLIIIGFYYWATNQFIVQRALGARTLDHGRWGAIFCGFLKLPILFIMVLPGALAIALYPNIQDPNQIFPTLAFDLLPVGVRGVVLAALVAAITSTVDSILNSASTLVTMDFVQRFRPQTSQTALVQIGRISTVGAMIVAIVWAPQIARFETLFGYLQSAYSYVTPPVVAVFLVGILWTRVNRHGAFWTLATIIPIGAVFFILNEVVGVFSIQFLYAAAISFVVSLVVLIGVSLLTGAPDREQVEDLTWRPAYWRRDTEELRGKPLYLNYRFWAVTLLISALVMVIIFW
ncbi:MAG TPA: sodium:solute symporter [Rubrobacteraceae bacterium]|nr:sodium:solute symporter [Rubrobacteraceae bacterium]